MEPFLRNHFAPSDEKSGESRTIGRMLNRSGKRHGVGNQAAVATSCPIFERI